MPRDFSQLFCSAKQGCKNFRIIWRFEKTELARGIIVTLKVQAVDLGGNSANWLTVHLGQKELGFQRAENRDFFFGSRCSKRSK